jgi:hypothetical protein
MCSSVIQFYIAGNQAKIELVGLLKSLGYAPCQSHRCIRIYKKVSASLKTKESRRVRAGLDDKESVHAQLDAVHLACILWRIFLQDNQGNPIAMLDREFQRQMAESCLV